MQPSPLGRELHWSLCKLSPGANFFLPAIPPHRHPHPPLHADIFPFLRLSPCWQIYVQTDICMAVSRVSICVFSGREGKEEGINSEFWLFKAAYAQSRPFCTTPNCCFLTLIFFFWFLSTKRCNFYAIFKPTEKLKRHMGREAITEQPSHPRL